MSTLIEYAPLLSKGLLVTIQVTLLGAAVALATAFVVGLMRLSRHRYLRWPAAVFVEVFRGTSMLVQLFWFFYALPFFGIDVTPLMAGVLVLGLNEGAYAAEVVRGTISSRPKGQTEACIALGIGPARRLYRILVPQSIPAMLPPFGNVFVDLLKNTSLVSLVTLADLTFTVQQVRAATGETATLFTALLVIYFALSTLLASVMFLVERRFALDRVPRRTPWWRRTPAMLTGRL